VAFVRTPLKINDKGIFIMPKLRSEAFCKMPLKLLRVFFRTPSNADGGISINALKKHQIKDDPNQAVLFESEPTGSGIVCYFQSLTISYVPGFVSISVTKHNQ